MKIEKIEYSDNRELIIVDDAVPEDKRINIYYDCCSMPYRICNSSCRDVQGIVDKRLKTDLVQSDEVPSLPPPNLSSETGLAPKGQ